MNLNEMIQAQAELNRISATWWLIGASPFFLASILLILWGSKKGRDGDLVFASWLIGGIIGSFALVALISNAYDYQTAELQAKLKFSKFETKDMNVSLKVEDNRK